MSKRTSNHDPDDSLPMSKSVSDAIGRFGLALMSLGACTALWRMLTGRQHATPGQLLGMALLAAGLVWLNWYQWRKPLQPIGYRPGDAIPPPLEKLPPMKIGYRLSRSITEWVLAGVVVMTMLSAVAVALAYPFLQVGVWIWWVIGPLLLYGLLSRRSQRRQPGWVLRIDADGIADLRSPAQGPVPWADIHHLECSVVRSRRQLVVWLLPESPSLAQFGWAQHASRVSAWSSGQVGDWFIDLDSLDCRAADVEQRAIQGLTAWRYGQRVATDKDVDSSAEKYGARAGQ